MCSNTSSTSGAGDATQILKKPKRQRVPKRGPGVAELEKILREQEAKVIFADKGNVPFVPDQYNFNHFSSPPPPAPPPNKYTFSGSRGNGERQSNGVRIAGSGMILPEEALFPTMWNSCESSIYEEVPKMPAGYPISTNFVNGSDQLHVLKKKQYCHQYPYPTINLFPQSESLPSPEKQSAAGSNVHIEPPSSQRSSHQNYSSILPEEEKMVGTKRPINFSFDNSSGSAPPIFHCQVSSFSNHTTSIGFNLQRVRDETLSRGEGDYGAMSGNFLIFGPPATPSSLRTQNSDQEFSKHPSLHFQCDMKERRMEGSGSRQKKKPFYSFLMPEEQTTKRREEDTTLGLNNEGPRKYTIDLNLKL